MIVGIQKGLRLGWGRGSVYLALFGTYSLGFWYGGKLVADDIDNGCTSNCLTGGTVLAVFFSIVFGSFALGQLAAPMAAVTGAFAALTPMYEVIDREPLIDGLSAVGESPSVPSQGLICDFIDLVSPPYSVDFLNSFHVFY